MPCRRTEQIEHLPIHTVGESPHEREALTDCPDCGRRWEQGQDNCPGCGYGSAQSFATSEIGASDVGPAFEGRGAGRAAQGDRDIRLDGAGERGAGVFEVVEDDDGPAHRRTGLGLERRHAGQLLAFEPFEEGAAGGRDVAEGVGDAGMA